MADFNDDDFPVVKDQNWCENGIISEIQGHELCCDSEDCMNVCGNNAYPQTGGNDCCNGNILSSGGCGLGEGDCDTNK